MVDAVVSHVVESIAEIVMNTVADEIGLLTGVETEVRKLASNFKKIRGVLDDAEERMIKDSNVKAWLEELEDICYEMDDILDEWNTMILKWSLKEDGVIAGTPQKKNNVCSFISSSCFCVKKLGGRRDIAIKIRKLNGRLESVINEMRQFKFLSNLSGSSSSSQVWKRVSSTSMVDVSNVQGRVSDLNILVKKLLGESSSGGDASRIKIMSIVGLGGIGKTTLAQLVCNDSRVKGHFDQQIWVCVSDPFDEIKVARAMIQSLKKDSSNLDELDPLLREINRMTYGRRFILVLDDVWTEDYTKFEPFLNSLKDGSHGSTILLTTRNVKVARVFGATYLHKVEILEESESWSLFTQIAFSGENRNKREELEDYGKKIIKKCNGLPLAIKTIASLLRFKSSADEWRNLLCSNIWDLEIAEVQLFPHLYLSYKNLPAPLKRCFTFCAVFPKDELIDVDKLIKIWMAEGYLGGLSSVDNIDIEAKGREYFEILARLSFFQEFYKDVLFMFEQRITKFKIHDIVHDFAQYLTKEKSLVIEGVSNKLLDESKAIGSKNLRHVFLFDKGAIPNEAYTIKINGYPRGFFGDGFMMRTLSLDLLSSLSNVRELSLCKCKLTLLTSQVENLIHLRYLDLSNNEDLKELPTAVCSLCNLQTLDISYCGITRLPQGSERLISLRHFIFKGNSLSLEGVTKLTRLQYLVGGVDSMQLGCLKNLNQLGGDLQINMNDNAVPEILKAELRSKIRLHGISISGFFTRSTDTLEALDPPPNLQLLSIGRLTITEFPARVMTKVDNLKWLEITAMFKLSTLPPCGKLPSLEKLIISYVPCFKFLGRSFLGIEETEGGTSASSSYSTIGFPKLKELSISSCKIWEEWEDVTQVEEDDTTLSIMPRLQALHLNACPKLKALPHRLLRKASALEIITLNKHSYSTSQVLSKPPNEQWWLEYGKRHGKGPRYIIQNWEQMARVNFI
ncbi:hypothetical protein Leryth_019989 [Lithospermum erythrorhizon]|nr:hypothetical protein Leryth_019989 [Lithospermum erythrorhizon]